ncbi:gibberellin 20 oxidase 1 [Hibiscus syriacus]|uniref:Gibberellin 20 oxidase 1 n=1 Tax=Hibiscus syriacus TaxID=106335 RepID=A0A6A2X8J7_HIBSY|nr:probable 2-oxoglutarate-dependent dioxygenase AOP1 [Hibiscus syriacus]KAE8658406.1 gibberellin 20 oxidase 1 [Hibiscus syriacus]
MVPVIDFSKQDLKLGSPEWDSVKSRVREALTEYGCFEASFDEVMALRESIFGALEELFDLPFQTKKLCASEKPFRGYNGSPSGVVESMSTDDAHIAENIEQRLTTILWPQGNINFSKTLVSFTQLASKLETTIMRMILESFGVEKYMDELTESTNYQLRVMKYRRPESSGPTFGIPAHRDSNMMTLLYQNEVNGLEIQNKDGEWMDVKLSPNSFIVMIGESFSVWLNGGLSSPYHQVTMKGNMARYSLGLFARLRGGYLVKTPNELVDDNNPMLFKPFDYEEFMKFHSTQIAQPATKSQALGYGLKAYCTA